ncbi:MAG: hypothetical protein HY863_21205 [Chloroflexi bacterium]|nr:hypothetical protein [Chloroflexota bacterium]
MKSSPRQFWQTFITLSVAISAAAIYQTEQQTQALFNIRSRIKWVVVMSVFIINLAAGLYLLLRRDKNDVLWKKLEITGTGIFQKILGIFLLIIAFPILWYLKFDAFSLKDPPSLIFIWGWFWLAFLQAAGLKMFARTSWLSSFVLAVLFDGIIFQSYFFLQPVTDYPFSLGWSEASRFYYGSLPFSKSVYGTELPLSVWHGSRYFLLSLAFLFGKISLWEARLWQAFLWLATNGLTAYILTRRLKWSGQTGKLLVGGWLFLFLFQGAVYYHLLICVIVIFAGVSPRHVSRSLAAIILASFWAGMSRVNWFPVPAMLAIAIYFLEEPYSKNNRFWRYLQKPILWGVVGMAAAFAGQFFYVAVSGNQDLSAFSSSFTSALLWYRWWPSDTNPLGVIPALLLVSLPPLAVLRSILRNHWNSLHLMRWLGLSTMLIVLMVGGLVVSTKIGGGGDLHNMDAYIVLLGLITSYFMSARVESESSPLPALKIELPLVIGFLLIVPVAFSFSRITRPIQYDHMQASNDLLALKETLQSYSRDGEVLFIYERHLLTFGMIPDIAVVPEYEVVSLTEMAISGNQPYLDKFYADLQSHRFTAIVARKQSIKITDKGDFAEESNAWNGLIAYRLLCEYEPTLTLDSSNIQVFTPKDTPKCP